MDLHHPHEREPHHRVRDRRRDAAKARRRQRLEEAEEEDERAAQNVRRVDQMARELNRPRDRQQPAPDEPRRRSGTMLADIPGKRSERGEREQREQQVRRFGVRRDAQRKADEQRLQRARDLALRPDDVRTEVRPLARRVVPQAEQKHLRLVFEEELAGEAKPESEGEERGKNQGPAGAHDARILSCLPPLTPRRRTCSRRPTPSGSTPGPAPRARSSCGAG